MAELATVITAIGNSTQCEQKGRLRRCFRIHQSCASTQGLCVLAEGQQRGSPLLLWSSPHGRRSSERLSRFVATLLGDDDMDLGDVLTAIAKTLQPPTNGQAKQPGQKKGKEPTGVIPVALAENQRIDTRYWENPVKDSAEIRIGYCKSRTEESHELAALKRRNRVRATEVENRFDSLGEEARLFHLELRRRPLKTIVHLRRLLNLVRLYGRQEVMEAITRAREYQTYDAAYVETILLQARRRRELPSPTEPRPQREELIDEIDLDEPDPGAYDRFCRDENYQEPLDD